MCAERGRVRGFTRNDGGDGGRRCVRRRAHGFTLIEMLVAITILGVIALMSWRGLDAVARARDAVSGEIGTQRGLQAAFGQLDADLHAAARDTVLGTALPGVLFGSSGELVVLTQARAVETGALRYRLVRYLVRGDAFVRISREVTSRAEIPPLLAEPVWPDALEQVLAHGVRGLALRVWTADGWAQPNDENTAALARAQSLPAVMTQAAGPGSGVEARLTLADGQEFVRAVMVRE